MAKQEYTCVSYIRGADGGLIPFSTLSEDEKQEVRARIIANVNRTLGEYLTEHPDEIEPLRHAAGCTVVSAADM